MDLTILMKFTITVEGGKPAKLDLSSAELGTALSQLVNLFKEIKNKLNHIHSKDTLREKA